MKPTLIGAALTFTLAASAAFAQTYCDAPLDADLTTVVSPAPSIPPNIAAFSGIWGPDRWNGQLCSVLIVKEVKPGGAADIVYVWGKEESWNIWRAGHIRVAGKIEGNKLTFYNTAGTHVQYTYADGQLKGVFGGNATITTKKK